MYYYQSNVEIQQNRQTYESMYDPRYRQEFCVM